MKALVAAWVAVLGLVCGSCSECTGPGNAWAFPDSPVEIEKTVCQEYQRYQAISPTTSYPSCGYTVAFGPKGSLMHPADGYLLQADWGEVVTNPADCADSHTWGQAWGYRCLTSHCTQGDWERIGDAKSRAGYWNAVSNACYLGLGFTASGIDYQTVQVEVSAYRGSGNNKVYKRAKGYIYVFRHTGGCLSATPAPPPSHQTPPPPRPPQ